MTQEELRNVFKYIVKKCDMLINNSNYKADVYTQDIIEDIAELCNHILDGDYGKLVETKEVKLEEEIDNQIRLLGGVHTMENDTNWYKGPYSELVFFAKHFFEFGLKVQKGE